MTEYHDIDTMETLRAERDALCDLLCSLALDLSDPEMHLPKEAESRAKLEQIEVELLASLDALENALKAN